MAKWISKTNGNRYKARLAIPGQGTRNKTFDRRIDAEKWLTAHQSRIDRGEWIDPQVAATPFESWASEWLATRSHLKPKTFEGYTSLLRVHLMPRFGTMPLQTIDPHAVDSWVRDLSMNGLSASRVRQAHQLLSMILKAAVRARMISLNAAEGTPLPRVLPRKPRFLSADQVDLLAAATPDRYRALIYTLAYGGLRWAEAVGLKYGSVQLLRRRIEIVETLSEVGGALYDVPPKTWEHRSVAIPPFVADMLAAHIGTYLIRTTATSHSQPQRGHHSGLRISVGPCGFLRLLQPIRRACAFTTSVTPVHRSSYRPMLTLIMSRNTSGTVQFASRWMSMDISMKTRRTISPSGWKTSEAQAASPPDHEAAPLPRPHDL